MVIIIFIIILIILIYNSQDYSKFQSRLFYKELTFLQNIDHVIRKDLEIRDHGDYWLNVFHINDLESSLGLVLAEIYSAEWFL